MAARQRRRSSSPVIMKPRGTSRLATPAASAPKNQTAHMPKISASRGAVAGGKARLLPRKETEAATFSENGPIFRRPHRLAAAAPAQPGPAAAMPPVSAVACSLMSNRQKPPIRIGTMIHRNGALTRSPPAWRHSTSMHQRDPVPRFTTASSAATRMEPSSAAYRISKPAKDGEQCDDDA